MRPNAMASAWPAAIAASAVSPVKPPAEISTPAPDRPEQHHCGRHVLVVDLGAAGAARARLDEVQIGKAKRIERLDGVGVERHRVRLAAAIGDAVGR